MTTLTLRILNGEKVGQSDEVTQSGYQVGRSHDMQMQLPEKTVSGHHLELLKIGEGWFVRNYSQSQYGTKLSGRLMKHEEILPLKAGDLLELNATILIGVEDTGQPRDWSFYMGGSHDNAQDETSVHEIPQDEGTKSGSTDAQETEINPSMPSNAAQSHRPSLLRPLSRKPADMRTVNASSSVAMNATEHSSSNTSSTTYADEEDDGPTPQQDQYETVPHAHAAGPMPTAASGKLNAKLQPKRKLSQQTPSNNDDKTSIAQEDDDEKTALIIEPGLDDDEPPVFKANTTDRILRIAKYVLGLIVFCIILRIAWMQSRNRPEPVITWPLDSAGNLHDEYYQTKIEGISIFYPNWEGGVQLTESEDKSHVEIMTRAGNKWNVPFRIVIDISQERDYLLPSRKAAFENWKAEKDASGWTCGNISSESFFRQDTDGGVPNLKMEYTRTVDNVDWYGLAAFFRYCGNAFWIMSEMPASEDSMRIQPMLRLVPVKIEKSIVNAFWDSTGKPDYMDMPLADLQQKAAQKLKLIDSGGDWADLENILSTGLVRAKLDNDLNVFTACEKDWLYFHDYQRKWLNQRINEYRIQQSLNKTKDMDRIRKEAQETFKNLANDYRRKKLGNVNFWKGGR